VCARAWCTFTLRSEEYAEAYTRALEAQAPPQEGAAAEGGLDLGEFGEALLGPLAPVELLRRPRLRDYVAYLLEVSHCLVARWSLSFSSARCLARSKTPWLAGAQPWRNAMAGERAAMALASCPTRLHQSVSVPLRVSVYISLREHSCLT
jgi:hypothetical protein